MATRSLQIHWAPGRRVGATFRDPREASGPGILLAHGAGAGRRHPVMERLARLLAAAGHPTLTFDYPYVAEGRRPPDRPATLLACHRAAAARLSRRVGTIVLAGKSMGGRMASHLAAEQPAPAALVCFGYPLLPPGKAEPRPTGHLHEIEVPMLFVSGSRDRLAPLPLLERVVGSLPGATLAVVEGADHGFGRTTTMADEAAARAAAWLAGITGP
jgi:predicted alpha/beta-hydrolase family hydrolase